MSEYGVLGRIITNHLDQGGSFSARRSLVAEGWTSATVAAQAYTDVDVLPVLLPFLLSAGYHQATRYTMKDPDGRSCACRAAMLPGIWKAPDDVMRLLKLNPTLGKAIAEHLTARSHAYVYSIHCTRKTLHGLVAPNVSIAIVSGYEVHKCKL